MNQSNMLNEHLNMIYIIEAINFSKIKSKAKDITSAAKSGNILKFNGIFRGMKEPSSEDMTSVAKSKFGPEYKESVKHIDKKGKKLPERIKTFLTLGRACLLKINKDSSDPEIQSKTQEQLKKLDDLLKRMQDTGMVETAITMIALAWIAAFFLSTIPILSVILVKVGIAFIVAAIFIFITREIINLFIEKKKAGKKVIS